jgi:lipopolysaccharide transport system ATP-binding protein
MPDTVIKVENLSKLYHLGELRHQTNSFRDKVVGFFNKNRGPKRAETIWALRDVSFEVEEGEVLGIIGRNGAGKSTLLKTLSRITKPTSGYAKIYGRVGSLLEIGTGFHPELTGRENIYLNGAILGMKKQDIERRFDEIVAFAEIEKFLDTPVKRYSSGMYMRLAFAVAAHLEPDILVVDEVLAVGDVEFQKKCLNKVEDAASGGTTVLLVSHNMASVLSLSTKCLLLDRGKLLAQGEPQEVIRTYKRTFGKQPLGQTDLSEVEHYGNGKARFFSISTRAFSDSGAVLPFPVTGCDIEFVIVIRAHYRIESTTVALTIYDEMENRLIDVNSLTKGESLSLFENQQTVVKFYLKNVRLKPDVYTIGLWLGIKNVADIDGVRYAASFKMEPLKKDILYTAPFPGVYACEFDYAVLDTSH